MYIVINTPAANRQVWIRPRPNMVLNARSMAGDEGLRHAACFLKLTKRLMFKEVEGGVMM